MKKTAKLLLPALLLCSVQAIARQPDYSGTWVLNLEKSKLESPPEGFTGSMFIIRQEGDRFKLTRYHYFGEKKKKLGFKMVADAKTRKVKVLFKGKLEWKGDSLLASIWRKNFSNIVNYHFGSSRDEFVADEAFAGGGKQHHNIWVFDRQRN